MKEQNWDDSSEPSKEFLEAATVISDDDGLPEPLSANETKNRATELRRRIEERLDSKRISLEYDYDEFERDTERLQ